LRSNTKGYGGKLARLTQKIAIRLHLAAESCTVCNSRSKRPDRKLLDTPSHMLQFLCHGCAWIRSGSVHKWICTRIGVFLSPSGQM
jgi:hypothetical protein